jgi:hypothetical protein
MASYLINNVGMNTTTRVEADSLSVEGNVVKFLASQKIVAVLVLPPGDLYEKKATCRPKQEPVRHAFKISSPLQRLRALSLSLAT